MYYPKIKINLVYLFIVFLGISFYIMNCYEPLRCDDLIYQYFWLDERTSSLKEPIDINNRIDHFYEALCSQYNHYLVMNGRISIHFLVSCFCGFLGKPLFNVLNTIIYLCFLLGCIKYLNIKSELESITTISILWLGLPIQYIFWYSISFAINYLWTSTALIYYFVLLRSIMLHDKKFTTSKKFLLFIASFLIGSLHEGFSIPLSGALFAYITFRHKQINFELVLMSIGVWIGTIFIVLSPGTLGRGTSSIINMNFNELILMKLDVLRYSKRLYLFLILFFIMFLTKKEYSIDFIKQHQFSFYYIAIDFFVVLAIPHYSQRIEFPLELLSLLLFTSLLYECNLWRKYKSIFISIFIIALVIHVQMTIHYAKVTSNEYKEMLDEYINSPHGDTHYRNVSIPKAFRSYVHRLDAGVEKDYISFVYNKKMHIK